MQEEERSNITREEANYILALTRIAETVEEGKKLGERISTLRIRIESELPNNSELILNDAERNTVSQIISICELLFRGRTDVLRDAFGVESVRMEEIQKKKTEIEYLQTAGGVDTDALQKKMRHRKKIPSRKLYISDMHFFHENVNTRMDMRGFSSKEEMNAHMISQWNSSVTKKDEVYILGDFSIARGAATNEVLHQLNGKKYLIIGNHDKYLDDREFDHSLFVWEKPYAEILDSKRKVILSHYPVFCYNGQYRINSDDTPIVYMLYGHVHNTQDERLVNSFIQTTKKMTATSKYHPNPYPVPCNMINCFCMFSDYIPMTLDEWVRIDRERRRHVQGI